MLIRAARGGCSALQAHLSLQRLRERNVEYVELPVSDLSRTGCRLRCHHRGHSSGGRFLAVAMFGGAVAIGFLSPQKRTGVRTGGCVGEYCLECILVLFSVVALSVTTRVCGGYSSQFFWRV